MISKWCYVCDTDKPIGEFGKNKTRPDGLQGKCKQCDREHKNRKYAENPKLHIDLSKQGRERKMKWFQDYKKTLECSKCNEKRWYLLDFHHTSNKIESVAQLVANNWSKDRIIEEIRKCIPLCSNCHRELHYFEKYGVLAEIA